MSETEDRADKQRQYLERIETGGSLAVTRYEPRDLPSLMDFSQMVARSQLCPVALQGKPQDVALVLMTGAERGFTAMQSLQNVYVIYGRVSVSASMLRALVLQDPACAEFRPTKLTDDSATIVVRRKEWAEGIVEEVTFTVAMAKKAGYYDRKDSRWPKEPGRMCLARATTVAADAYFPAVKAGLMERSEAEDLADEAGEPRKLSARAQETAQRLKAAADEAQVPAEEEEAVDAEIVDEEPAQPEPGVSERLAEAAGADVAAEAGLRGELAEVVKDDAASFRKEWLEELMEVGGVGEGNGEQIVKAGYISWKRIHAATERELQQVPRVGERTAKNLKRRAEKEVGKSEEAKEEAPAEPAPAAEAPPTLPPETDPGHDDAHWRTQPPPEGLKPRPVFRGKEWMDGLKKVALEQGATWPQVLDKAREISGGYDPARLDDPQWRVLIAWLRAAKQEGLFDVTREAEEEPPKYELVQGHPKYTEEPISEEERAQLLRYAEKTGKGEAALREFLSAEWGFTLEAAPQPLRYALLDWVTDGDYQEVVDAMVEGGQARRIE